MSQGKDNDAPGCMFVIGLALLIIGGFWLLGAWGFLIAGLLLIVLAVLAAQ